MPFNKAAIFNKPIYSLAFFILLTLIITLHGYGLKPRNGEIGEKGYTHYNNYVIFTQSYHHLVENKDLYLYYHDEYFDLYKYSPTFSFFMAPFAKLPDVFGLAIWNLINVLVLFFAIWKLPIKNPNARIWMLGLILIELVTSIQNAQSNGLIAGLIIFAFHKLEKKQMVWASLFIVLTVFIKIFGLVALALFIFYPQKGKALFYSLGWTLVLLALPLLVISTNQLSYLYQSWYYLLQNDQAASWGLSVAGWLYSWFGLHVKMGVLIIGTLLYLLPLLRIQYLKDLKFRVWFLASTLIWMVIFNHKAESPSFVIAISGVAIWFFSQKINSLHIGLLALVCIFSILSPTDIFPTSIRENFITPYALKAVPCILVWLKISYDLIFYKQDLIQEESPV